MKIRVAIIDDELLARKRMRKLLSSEPEVEVIGECENGPAAIEFVQAEHPDLIFLDVQMPEVSGFDVLRALPREQLPIVVFVTAHDQHAVEAFQVHALDYLLKPISHERLHESVARALKLVVARDATGVSERLMEMLKTPKSEPAYLNRFAIKNGDRTVFVRVEDVDYIESASNYVVLHTRNENHVVRDTLVNLENTLPPKSFLRISRSVIVNVQRVKELQPGLEGEHTIVLQGGKQLIMTRGLREVQERLQYS